MRVFGFMLNSLTFYFIPPNMRTNYFVLNPQTGSHDVDAVVDAADGARYRYWLLAWRQSLSRRRTSIPCPPFVWQRSPPIAVVRYPPSPTSSNVLKELSNDKICITTKNFNAVQMVKIILNGVARANNIYTHTLTHKQTQIHKYPILTHKYT